MSRDADRLIEQLSRELAPVRRIPRLRSAASVVLLGAALVALALLALQGARPGLIPFALPLESSAILAGLLLVGLGGTAAALGGSVPGRERVARAGSAGLAAGLLLAAGAGFSLLLHARGLARLGLDWSGLQCLLRAGTLALVPALLLAGFVRWAAPARPLAALAAAAGGALGFGAVAVHLSCPSDEPVHLAAFHALAPVLGGVVLWALLVLLRRVRS